MKAEFWEIFDDIDAEPGPAAQAVARSRAKAFASKWRKLYPAAVDCLEDDFEHLITYLRFPAEHHARIRHSNFIERTFGETRRRVKVIGRLPGERSLPVAGVGRARPGQPRLARRQPDHPLDPPARRTPPRAVRPRPHSTTTT